MPTSSFDTTFHINPDWGVKNLEAAFAEYEKHGPRYSMRESSTPVLKPSKEFFERLEEMKKH